MKKIYFNAKLGMQVVVALLVSAFVFQAYASEQIYICPLKIDPSHVQLTYTENGWTPFVESHLRLTGISFMDGSPEKIGHLKPVTSSKYTKNDFDTWSFEGDFPDGKWLSCQYEGRQISLSKRIDDGLKRCSVLRYKEQKYAFFSFVIKCK